MRLIVILTGLFIGAYLYGVVSWLSRHNSDEWAWFLVIGFVMAVLWIVFAILGWKND